MQFIQEILALLLSLLTAPEELVGATQWAQMPHPVLQQSAATMLPDGTVMSREPWTPSQGDLPPGYTAEKIRYASNGKAIEAYLFFPAGAGPFRAQVFARGQIDGEYEESEITGWVGPMLADRRNGREYCGIAMEYPGEAGSAGEVQLGADDVEAVKHALAVLDAEPRAYTVSVGLVSSSRGGTSGGMALTDPVFAARVGAWCLRSGLVDLADPNLGVDPVTTFGGIVPNYPAGGTAALMAVSPAHHSTSIPASIPVKILHGVQDQTVPITQARAFHADLIAQGHSTSLIEYPGEDHRLQGRQNDVIKQVQDWLFLHL